MELPHQEQEHQFPPYCSTGVRYPFVASNPFVPQKAVQSQKGINVTMAASPSKPVTRNLVTAVPIIPPRRTPSFNKINFSSSTAIAWDRQRQVSVSAPKPTVSRQSFLSTQSGTNAVRVSDERLLVGSFSGQIDRSRQMNLCMTPPRRQMSAVQLNMEYRRPMCTDMQMGMEYVRIGMGRSMQVGAPSPKSPFQVDIGRNDSTSSLKNKDDGVPIKDAVKVPYSKNVGQTVTVEGSVQNKSSCVETNTGQDSTSYVHNEDINRSMSSDAVKDVDCKRLVTASTSTDGSLSVNEGNSFFVFFFFLVFFVCFFLVGGGGGYVFSHYLLWGFAVLIYGFFNNCNIGVFFNAVGMHASALYV